MRVDIATPGNHEAPGVGLTGESRPHIPLLRGSILGSALQAADQKVCCTRYH